MLEVKFQKIVEGNILELSVRGNIWERSVGVMFEKGMLDVKFHKSVEGNILELSVRGNIWERSSGGEISKECWR